MENGGISEICYAYSGFNTMKTYTDGRVKTETRDYLGRLIRMEETLEGRVLRIAYAHNAAGDFLGMTDPRGMMTAMAYDSLGRRISLSDPHTGAWSYAYDGNGNLVKQTDSNGDTIQYSYDALNRPVQKIPSRGAKTVYAYDAASSGKGKLSGMIRGDVVDGIGGYDALGRVTKRVRSYSASQKSFETSYVYDDSGKVSELTYSDGYKVLYEYHPGTGLLKDVTGNDGKSYAEITDYTAAEQMAQIDYGNGTATRYGYDPVSLRLNSIVTSDKSCLEANDLQRMSYSYSPAGNVTSITDDLKGVTYGYQYDAMQRLTREMGTGGGPWMAHSYDDAGNILTRTLGQTQMAYHYGDPSRQDLLTGITVNGTAYSFAYDAPI